MPPHHVKEIDKLINDLKNHEDRDERERCARSLGIIGDKRAVEPLIEVFTKSPFDEDYVLRMECGSALAKIGDERAFEPLVSELQHVVGHDWDVPISLVKIGGERAIKPLIELLNNETLYIRSAAASGLELIGDESAIEPLIKSLNRTKERLGKVDESAAKALEKIRERIDRE